MPVGRRKKLQVRLSTREWDRLQETAEFFDLTLSEIARDAIRRHIIYLQHGPQPFPRLREKQLLGKGQRP